MASKLLYVTSEELHNPTFTSQFVFPHSDVSPDGGIAQLEATKSPDTELEYSPLNLSTMADSMPDPGSQLEITREKESDGFPVPRDSQSAASDVQHVEHSLSSVISETPVDAQLSPTSQTENIAESYGKSLPSSSPLILVLPTEERRSPSSSLEIAAERQNVPTRSGSHEVHSMPGTVAEQETIDCVPIVSTSTHEGPSFSENDDVQFILSITRKRRRKRQRLDPLPANQRKDAIVDVKKHTSTHNNNDADLAATLNSHTIELNPTAAESLSDHHPEMGSSLDRPSFPSVSPRNQLATNPSLAALILKTPKQTTKKHKRKEETGLTTTWQTLPTKDEDNGMIFAKIPFLQRQLQSPENLRYSGPVSSVQHLAGTGLDDNSKFPPHSEACCPLHPTSPWSRLTSTNIVQPPWPTLAGPIANTTPASVALMSESLHRRPSLYAIPQWHTSLPSSGVVIQDVSANSPRTAHHGPNGVLDLNLRGISPGIPHMAESRNVSSIGTAASGRFAQSTPPSIEVSTSQISQSKPSHPPNMLVDIAQTCQDNFPFALIAKRHNQPIQKVFDTFSAVIQLPLLRSAVDARRPGKLGSLRMKEFRAMKKGLKEVPKGRLPAKKRDHKAEINGV